MTSSCQHKPEQRGPFLYIHLEGCKAVESLKDCNARVASFTATEGACPVSFSCASPLSATHASTDSPAAADQAQGHFTLCPTRRTSTEGQHGSKTLAGGTWEELPIGKTDGKRVLPQLVCSAWLKASWDACNVCRLRKRSSVSPRSVNLLSQELSCVRPKRDSRESRVAKKEFLFWVLYIRSRLTCIVSKRSSACESPSVTVALGQLQVTEVCPC